MAAPFPAERTSAAKSSKLCNETTPIPGQRLPQAQPWPATTGEAKPTAAPLAQRQGGTQLSTTGDSEASHRYDPGERVPGASPGPQHSSAGNTELFQADPPWQHKPRAAAGPAQLQQAPTCRAEPTQSKPRARLWAGTADPGREQRPTQETGDGGEGEQVAAQPGFGRRRWL